VEMGEHLAVAATRRPERQKPRGQSPVSGYSQGAVFSAVNNTSITCVLGQTTGAIPEALLWRAKHGAPGIYIRPSFSSESLTLRISSR
jgi:hypothetical protein